VSRWIVSTIPPWIVLILLVILIVGGATLLQLVLRRRFPALKGEAHNDAARFTYGVISFVYAFFMGFLVSSMWGLTNTADGNAQAEGAAGIQMARAATYFDTDDAERIRQSLLAYEQAALDEWTENNQSPSPATEAALDRLYAAYNQVGAGTDTQKTFLATSYTDLEKISEARTVRLMQAQSDTGPPMSLWAVIILTSALVVGTAIVYGVERPLINYSMVAVVGVLVATNLFLVLELSHPFVGEVSTSAEPLQEVVRYLSGPSS
jgi:hypothetical protein